MSTQLYYLRIPLHKLFYIDDVEEFAGLTQEEINNLRSEYSDSELQAIVRSVKWAIENRGYDFSSLLPNMRISNEEIYNYLCKLDNSLDKI